VTFLFDFFESFLDRHHVFLVLVDQPEFLFVRCHHLFEPELEQRLGVDNFWFSGRRWGQYLIAFEFA
jgi:hypothetical protein